MKTFLKSASQIIFFSTIFLNVAFAQNPVNDDVYYTPGQQNPAQPSNVPSQNAQPQGNENTNQNDDYYTNSNKNFDDPENTNITNNYYNNDYYDYAYSARLRRFHHNYNYDYYDNYYTNSYWYDYNPYSYGVSIYLGYNWWNPPVYYYYHPSPFWAMGFSTYSYYDPWFYRPYNYGYSGYGHGYGNGYMNGFYDGMAYANGYPYHQNYNANPYYFNTYDRSSYHNGPRNTSTGQGYRTVASSSTVGQKYIRAIETGQLKDTRSNFDNLKHEGYDVEGRGGSEIKQSSRPETIRPGTESLSPGRGVQPVSPDKKDEIINQKPGRDVRPSSNEPGRIQPKDGRDLQDKGTTRPVTPEPKKPVLPQRPEQPRQDQIRPQIQRPEQPRQEQARPQFQRPEQAPQEQNRPQIPRPEQPRQEPSRPQPSTQPSQPSRPPVQPSNPPRNGGNRFSEGSSFQSSPSNSSRNSSSMAAPSHSRGR